MTIQSNQERLRALRTLIGARLRSLREHKDLSQPDLADQANIGRSTVSLIETGERAPGADIIIQLVKALDTSADYLLGISDNPNILAAPNHPILHDPYFPELAPSFLALDDERKRAVVHFVNLILSQPERRAAHRGDENDESVTDP